MYVLPDGRRINPEMAFTLGEGDALVQYAPGFLKYSHPQEREAMGITWEDPAPVDLVPVVITPWHVVQERERRLSLGFDYDFGDARGVHRIGTNEQDMKGWDEVSKASQAAIAVGMPTAPMHIVTETGPATVTALEWQQILLAASVARQPIWAASFALQAMAPIPADYTSDTYWSA